MVLPAAMSEVKVRRERARSHCRIGGGCAVSAHRCEREKPSVDTPLQARFSAVECALEESPGKAFQPVCRMHKPIHSHDDRQERAGRCGSRLRLSQHRTAGRLEARRHARIMDRTWERRNCRSNLSERTSASQLSVGSSFVSAQPTSANTDASRYGT